MARNRIFVIFVLVMAESQKERIKEQVALLPLSPGVYQFVDRNGTIIYVGKAKSLRKRVSSYFVENRDHSAKSARARQADRRDPPHRRGERNRCPAVGELAHQDPCSRAITSCSKDDKTYPWIVVRREHFPRVESTRQLARDGSRYYGPYGSLAMQRSVLDFIREVVPLRTCRLDLAPERIAQGRYGVCLQYHLGNCRGPVRGCRTRKRTGSSSRWSRRC